jgi:exonuclease VII small subunit
MDTQQIISELESERDRLEQAISALRGSMNGRRGIAAVGNGRRGRRRLSAAAKRRISEMRKKRWAERKRAAKAA